MKLRTIAIGAAAFLMLSAGSVIAAETVGYNYLPVPAQTDVLLTAPFTQEDEGTFTADTVTATSLTVTDSLPAGQFAGSHYVRILDGGARGLWSTISSNTASEIVLEDPSILAGVAAGDSFVVIPHQTLESVFPDNMEGVSFEASPAVFNRLTQILIPNTATVGINKPPSTTYYYFNNEWRKFGQSPTVSFNDAILPPQEYFILRNGGNSELKYVSNGKSVPLTFARILPTDTIDNDIPAATGMPVPVTLQQLNLAGTSAFKTTTVLFNREDELLVYDNGATGLNKPPAATYFYFNGAWRKFGASPTISFDDEVLPAGAGFLIRKAGGTLGSAIWYQPSALK